MPVWVAALAIGVACAGFAAATALRPPGDAGRRVCCGPRALAPRPAGRGPLLGRRPPLAPPGTARGAGLGGPPRPRPVGLRVAGDPAVLQALGLGWVGLAGAGAVLAGVTLAHALPITPGAIASTRSAPCSPSPRPTAGVPRTRWPSRSSWRSPRLGRGSFSGPSARCARGVCQLATARAANWHAGHRAPRGAGSRWGRRWSRPTARPEGAPPTVVAPDAQPAEGFG
jgi:hypothetical protein